MIKMTEEVKKRLLKVVKAFGPTGDIYYRRARGLLNGLPHKSRYNGELILELHPIMDLNATYRVRTRPSGVWIDHELMAIIPLSPLELLALCAEGIEEYDLNCQEAPRRYR